MVFFFKTSNNEFVLYMGKDKFENEELIRYGLPTDVWFHVDGLSSAHVYLRMPEGMGMEHIPEDVLTDCAQLVKANSIEGSKQNNVKIVYTPWENLMKRQSMEVGQVGFHDEKQCKYVTVAKKDNIIVNRINKTKVEKPTEIVKQTRDEWDKSQKVKVKAQRKAEEEERAKQKEQWEQEKQARSYDNLMNEENMTSNADLAGKGFKAVEDDFM